jgi:hypothetical protein
VVFGQGLHSAAAVRSRGSPGLCRGPPLIRARA